jgi:hypothetical protein
MDRLKTPFAYNKHGKVVKAQEAVKNQVYYCPCCDIKMVVKEGTKYRKHFSHPASGTCTSEGILHRIAKNLLLKAIEEDIKLKTDCDICRKSFWKTLPQGTFTKGAEEVRVGPYKCDIVLYSGNEPALAVEIKNTHGIGKKKGKELPINWIEVNASSIIENNTALNPIQAKLDKSVCYECKNNLEDPDTKKRISNLVASLSMYSAK